MLTFVDETKGALRIAHKITNVLNVHWSIESETSVQPGFTPELDIEVTDGEAVRGDQIKVVEQQRDEEGDEEEAGNKRSTVSPAKLSVCTTEWMQLILCTHLPTTKNEKKKGVTNSGWALAARHSVI